LQARFSIMGLMAAVLLLAVGFAGLRTASALSASAIFTFTLTLLAAALLGVAASRGRSRIACLGFGLFGWIYLLATFWLWPGPNGVSAPPGPVGESSTEPPPMVSTTIRPGLTGAAPYAGRVVNLLHYRRIGHMLAAIAFGLLGGLLGSIFSALSEAREGRRANRERETGQ
jgi:hypothetical protein